MPAHAPPATPTAGYTVMSWHCVSVRGANGDATPYFLASASTCERYDAESDLLDDIVRAPSDVTALSKLTRALIFLRHRRTGVATPASTATTERIRRNAASGTGVATTATTAATGRVDAEYPCQRIDRRLAARRIGRARARRQRRQFFTRRVELRRLAIGRRVHRRRAVRRLIGEAVRGASRRIGEDRRRAHDRRLLRMRERNLDDFDAEVRVVRVPGVVVAARQAPRTGECPTCPRCRRRCSPCPSGRPPPCACATRGTSARWRCTSDGRCR